MKKLYILPFLLAVCTMMYAAKAAYISRMITLQDGRTVIVHMQGDENLHFLYSDDGELIIQDSLGYHVATDAEKDSLDRRIEQYSRESEVAQAKALAGLRANTGESIEGYQLFPHVGKQKVLVLMAEFSDVKFTFSKNNVSNLFNSSSITNTFTNKSASYTSGQADTIRRNYPYYSYSSVKEYFKASSDGQFEPSFDVFGPYTLSKSAKYYGNGKDERIKEFLVELCDSANTDVDFSEYDQDGDGYADLVYVIFAGYGANTSGDDNLIWSKCGGTNVGTYDGVKVYRYGVNNELLGYEGWASKLYITGIGVICHEFSHALGLPDFYPTADWFTEVKIGDVTKKIRDCTLYDNQSMEDWDLMDNGFNVKGTCWPPLYSAYERELMGWTKIDTLNAPSDITMKPLLHGGKAYKIMNDNDATGNEYWILEVFSADSLSEKWHQYMPGYGLLITHVNYNADAFTSFQLDEYHQPITKNYVNNTQGSPRITIIPADGYLPTSYRQNTTNPLWKMEYDTFEIQLAGDTYPGTLGITEFNNYKAYTGIVDKPITEITQYNDFSVSFKFMGGAPTLLGDVNNDTYITMADANAVVNYYLAEDKDNITNFNIEAADVNKDEKISMADANAIVNIYLSNDTGNNESNE